MWINICENKNIDFHNYGTKIHSFDLILVCDLQPTHKEKKIHLMNLEVYNMDLIYNTLQQVVIKYIICVTQTTFFITTFNWCYSKLK
jgi:hypothetical protein